MTTKDEILAYVKKTPANTNVNVLGTMLDSVADASGGAVLGTLNITSDTEATCSLSFDEIEAELQKKNPVILSWAYKPDDAPFYVFLGSDFVEENTGSMTIKINEEYWNCQSGNNWKHQ